MKLKIIVFCLLLAGTACSGIKEDMSECYNTHKLILSYLGDGSTEIFSEKIDRVELYVFDAQNRCVADFEVPAGDVAARTAKLPPLQPGNYRIVALGNPYSTEVDKLEARDFNTIRFAAADYLTKATASGNDPLYHAAANITIEPFTGKNTEQTTTVRFASSHYDLAVDVLGFPELENNARATSQTELKICGVTPCTDFTNRVCGEACDYTLETTYDAQHLVLSNRSNIMRHTDHENVDVCLSVGGTEIAKVNLAEFLRQHPAIDCSKHEVLIPIEIRFIEGEVVITIPEWAIDVIQPDFSNKTEI